MYIHVRTCKCAHTMYVHCIYIYMYMYCTCMYTCIQCTHLRIHVHVHVHADVCVVLTKVKALLLTGSPYIQNRKKIHVYMCNSLNTLLQMAPIQMQVYCTKTYITKTYVHVPSSVTQLHTRIVVARIQLSLHNTK